MDGVIGGPWTEAHIQTFSHHNEVGEQNEKKSKQKSRRKWWKMSRSDAEEKTNGETNTEGIFFKSPSPNETILNGNVKNDSSKRAKEIDESTDCSLKFSANKKPFLDPLDLNNVKKPEKKKKRKDQKNSNAESIGNKKTSKSKSASVHSPRLQNTLKRDEQSRESPRSPTDSEFWGFDKSRSPLNFNIEQPLDRRRVTGRNQEKDMFISDEEYDDEMAYRFPILYKRLSKMAALPQTGSCETERHISTPKPRFSPEDRPSAMRNSFKTKSPDVVHNSRKDAYNVQDTVRSEFDVQDNETGSDVNKDATTTSVNRSRIADKLRSENENHWGKEDNNEIKSKPSVLKEKSGCQLKHDDLAADIDKLLEELDDIW